MSGNKSIEKGSKLPENFFDFDKKTKKTQEDELAKEMEEFEREMETLQAESDAHLRDEFERLQEEKNTEEIEQQMDQWKRMLDLEKRAEALRNKIQETSDTPAPKRFKNEPTKQEARNPDDFEQCSLEDVEDFEDKLLDWRSKGLKR